MAGTGTLTLTTAVQKVYMAMWAHDIFIVTQGQSMSCFMVKECTYEWWVNANQ